MYYKLQIHGRVILQSRVLKKVPFPCPWTQSGKEENVLKLNTYSMVGVEFSHASGCDTNEERGV